MAKLTKALQHQEFIHNQVASPDIGIGSPAETANKIVETLFPGCTEVQVKPASPANIIWSADLDSNDKC